MDPILETALRPAIKQNISGSYFAIARLFPGVEPEVALESFPVLFGRAVNAGISLDHETVSREHARISEKDGKLLLADLDSRNGTFLNRAQVKQEEVELYPGDLIRLGDVLLRFLTRPLDLEVISVESTLVGGLSLHEVRRLIRMLGPTPLRLLITGPTGTGKELVAREVHSNSGRSGPFIALNCAALPENLVESELFGHVKGAFTGAARDKSGLFEAASGGTLFLDEVTELPVVTQAKLLRVVETGEVRRVGAVSSIQTNCRILSATNHEMGHDIEQGRFRADLAARLAEAEIKLPPLSDRAEDLPLLIKHLARRAGYELVFNAEAMELLACYSWPLNVRELDNLVRTLESWPRVR